MYEFSSCPLSNAINPVFLLQTLKFSNILPGRFLYHVSLTKSNYTENEPITMFNFLSPMEISYFSSLLFLKINYFIILCLVLRYYYYNYMLVNY